MADKFNTTPTYNPAAKDNLGLALQHLVKYVSTNLECSIPAKIVKYDRTTHVATVQPLVKIQYPDGDQVKSEERQQFDVTVLQFCHGGFVIDIPLSEGDTGWVVASDRDAVLAKKANANIKAADNKGAQDPNTSQKHRYNLGFFIPDSWATIPYDMEKFDGKMVIGDVENIDDPAAYITLDHDGRIVIHADKEVIFESELITFDCNVHIKKDLEVDGNSLLHGNLEVEGKDNKINDMTEQEIKFFSDVVKKEGNTYLVLSKTNILRSDLEKVDEIEFKGEGGGGEDPDDPDDPSGGGGGGGIVNNVVAWVPFVCRRKDIGDSSVEYFLPEHTAKVNDNVVDFTTNFPASETPGWRTSSETNNNGTIYCTINKKQDGSFVGHFANAAVQIGTVNNNEEVMYCFAVCKIDGSIGDGGVLTGITQYAAGEMVFKEIKVGTPFEIETIGGVKWVTNCNFRFDMKPMEADDFELPEDGSVYLVIEREKDNEDAEWEARLSDEEEESDEDYEVRCVKLYDVANGEVTMDYRTTFMNLTNPSSADVDGKSVDFVPNDNDPPVKTDKLQLKGFKEVDKKVAGGPACLASILANGSNADLSDDEAIVPGVDSDCEYELVVRKISKNSNNEETRVLDYLPIGKIGFTDVISAVGLRLNGRQLNGIGQRCRVLGVAVGKPQNTIPGVTLPESGGGGGGDDDDDGDHWIQVVVDVQYDTTTHQLKMIKRNVNVRGIDWDTGNIIVPITTATPLSKE